MASCIPSCAPPEPPLHSHSSLCKEHRQECLCYYTLRAAPGAIPVSSVPPASSRHLSNRQRDAGATWLEPTDYAETCLSSIAPHSRGDRRFRPPEGTSQRDSSPAAACSDGSISTRC